MDEIAWRSPVPGTKWVRTWRLGEWLSDPLSPLSQTLVVPALAAAREMGGGGHLGWKLPRGWHLSQPWYCIVNGYYYARADLNLTSFIRFLLLDVPRMERAIARWQKTDLPAYMQRLSAQRTFSLQAATSSQLLQHIQDLCLDASAWWHLISLDAGGAGFMENLFAAVYKHLLKEETYPAQLLAGLDTPAVAGERRLYETATRYADCPEIVDVLAQDDVEKSRLGQNRSECGAGFWAELHAYLEEYGHQVYSLDLLFATPREDPGLLFPVIGMMMHRDALPPAIRLKAATAKRERAEQELASLLAHSPIYRAMLFGLLRRCRTLAERREATVFAFQRTWPLLRQAVLELGKRLTCCGVLEHRDDVFFVTKTELWSLGQWLESRSRTPPPFDKAAIEERVQQWEWQRTLAAPDCIPAADDPIWRRQRGPAFWGTRSWIADNNGAKLVGLPASPGCAQGPARVVRSTADFQRFRHGDVLVAVTTSPIWTPLFGLAAAVVTETGGITSHASVVAREYGIPAVVATGCASQLLHGGELVEVDGTAGTVCWGGPLASRS